MSRPGWAARLRSHFTDVVVERLDPPPGPPLELLLRNGRYMLASPGAIYSHEERYRSFRGAFSREERARLAVDELLVLGFGLGSVPLILERLYGLRPRVTGVESDPRVAGLARRRLPPGLLARTGLVEADAIDWISGTAHRWPLVCADLFVDTQVPSGCSSETFLQALRAAVAPGGLLLFSRLVGEPPAERSAFAAVFARTFPGHSVSPVGGNEIFRWVDEAAQRAG